MVKSGIEPKMRIRVEINELKVVGIKIIARLLLIQVFNITLISLNISVRKKKYLHKS